MIIFGNKGIYKIEQDIMRRYHDTLDCYTPVSVLQNSIFLMKSDVDLFREKTVFHDNWNITKD